MDRQRAVAKKNKVERGVETFNERKDGREKRARQRGEKGERKDGKKEMGGKISREGWMGWEGREVIREERE